MADNATATFGVAAIDRIAALAKEATGFEVLSINTNGLGAGLPTTFPVGFDRRLASTLTPSLRDLKEFAEKWRLYPERRNGTHDVDTLTSFIDLTNRLKTDHSVIFAQTTYPDLSLAAVINFHEVDAGGKADFRDHIVSYEFPVTEEFAKWLEKNATGMTQVMFAAFIEDRIAEIASPTPEEEAALGSLFQTKFGTPAELMALSRGLEVSVNSAVKQQHSLSSGEKEIVFTEAHAPKVTVPGLFMVNVPAFLGGEPVRIPARLRYRVNNGTLAWFYELYRWKELLRARVIDDLDAAIGGTGLPAYEGSQA